MGVDARWWPVWLAVAALSLAFALGRRVGQHDVCADRCGALYDLARDGTCTCTVAVDQGGG